MWPDHRLANFRMLRPPLGNTKETPPVSGSADSEHPQKRERVVETEVNSSDLCSQPLTVDCNPRARWLLSAVSGRLSVIVSHTKVEEEGE